MGLLLPGHSRGTLHAWYWPCSGGNHLFMLKRCWITQFLGVLSSPTDQLGPGDTLPSRWVYDSAPCLSVSKQGFRARKNPELSMQIRQICTPPSFLVRVYHQVVSEDEQSCCLEVLYGYHRYELWLPRSLCWLLQVPPLLIPVTFPVIEHYIFPHNPHGMRPE